MTTSRIATRATALLAFCVFITGITLAQSFGPPALDLSWHSIDGGGGVSTSGSLQLSGVMGQPEGPVVMTAGVYSLTGGFLPGTVPPASDCPGDIVASGTVNIDDLLAVISAWGACPTPPAACSADIAPVGGNGIVNIDDLLAVISAWGPCP